MKEVGSKRKKREKKKDTGNTQPIPRGLVGWGRVRA